MIAVALLLAACTAREREPAAASDPGARESPAEPERAPLVTLELGLLGPEAHALLVARHGSDSPLAKAEALLLVHHRIEAPWHIYWVNPGDSGLRTKLSFDAAGVELGPVVYPGPDRFVASGGQVSYGWERDAILFVPLTKVGADASVNVRSDWLACDESCIPGHSEASAQLGSLPTRDEPIVRAMVERIPEPAGERLRSRWTASKLRVEAAADDLRLLAFFPYVREPANLQATTLDASALELDYRFAGSSLAALEPGQGVLSIESAGETRWLELAVPWP